MGPGEPHIIRRVTTTLTWPKDCGTNEMSFGLIYGLCPYREWKEKLLQEACCLLAGEMNLSPSAPGGMVDFRRTLVLSFFFKFYLTVLQKLGRELNGNVSGSILLPG